ncbi:MAG: M3 family metallopeptidase [Candidatus Nanoarchaeia archaeon]
MQEDSTIQTRWDLQHYFYESITDEQIQKDFNNWSEYIQQYVIEKYPNKLRDLKTKDDWQEYFNDVEENEKNDLLPKIFLYLNYMQSLETQNQDIIKKINYYENKTRELQEQLLFIDEEFRAIGEEELLKLSKRDDLQKFSKFFIDKANTLKYELDTPVERALLLTSSSNAKNCNVQLFDELNNSYEFNFIDENDQEKLLTQEELMAYVHSPNRELRKRVGESLKQVYLTTQTQITHGNVYSSIVKSSVNSMKLRGFKTVMSSRNLSEDMEDETIDFLLNQVQEKFYPLYSRFLQLKQKALGVEELYSYDIHAPISSVEKKFPFEEGLDLFLNSLKTIDNEMHTFSSEMFHNGRVDVFSKKGKQGGAYCSFYKNFNSFVLLNYNNTLNDVFTLAHEFGHAFHGQKLQHQPSRYYETGLCLAETASVFNELLLSHTLLNKLEQNERLEVLNEELGGFFGTITRQIMYTVFEKRVHESFLNNQELTYKDFNIMFREEQEKLYQGAVQFTTSKEEDFSWSRIPHIFHTPFYCYSYSFGQILSIALYQMYLEEETDEFMKKYKTILQAGSSTSPKELLQEVGIDINSSDFYETAATFISSKLDEFEELIKEE